MHFFGHQKDRKIAGGNASESVKGSRQNAFFPVRVLLRCVPQRGIYAAQSTNQIYALADILRARHDVF
jgi:hypothetical protein